MSPSPEPISEWKPREASSEDASKIAAVHKASCLEIYPNAVFNVERADIEAANLDSAERIEQWRFRIENQIGTEKVWVVERENEVLGFCYAIKREARNEIYSIYIIPGYTRKGIGKKLMESALEWVGEDQDLTLEVVPYNESAIGFYESLGFQTTNRKSEFTFNPDTPGKVIPLIEMVKSKVQTVMEQ